MPQSDEGAVFRCNVRAIQAGKLSGGRTEALLKFGGDRRPVFNLGGDRLQLRVEAVGLLVLLFELVDERSLVIAQGVLEPWEDTLLFIGGVQNAVGFEEPEGASIASSASPRIPVR